MASILALHCRKKERNMQSELISEKLNHYRDTGEISSSKTAVVIDNKYEIVTMNHVSWIKKSALRNGVY